MKEIAVDLFSWHDSSSERDKDKDTETYFVIEPLSNTIDFSSDRLRNSKYDIEG